MRSALQTGQMQFNSSAQGGTRDLAASCPSCPEGDMLLLWPSLLAYPSAACQQAYMLNGEACLIILYEPTELSATAQLLSET